MARQMTGGPVRLLLRAKRAPDTGGRFTFGAERLSVKDAEPLFSSIEPERGRAQVRGFGAGTAARWYTATFEKAADQNPWDICHQLVSSELGMATDGVDFAEPDLAQRWIWRDGERGVLAAEACDAPKPPDSEVYATFKDDTAFDDRHHSQLAPAREQVGMPNDPVRIAHLDTGYDPEHGTVPQRLRTDLQKNFSGEGDENDARDDRSGLVRLTYGHGTGTLSLLSGRRPGGGVIGGAANLEVVPIRIANFVALFWTSAVAKAFDYVHQLWGDPRHRVDVVTMSMGGLASAAWATAVNALYERGIFVVTAAGNNYGHLPTRFTVFPARFHRVLAACGVMADGRPFADLPIRKMAGCYGPQSKEESSLSAYTPNVPWARIGCSDIVDADGRGTSAATPQIAAAAALWIQHHRTRLASYSKGWMRVEAARKALFESAHKVDDTKHFGQGFLRAEAALKIRPARASSLVKQPEDSAHFALLRLMTPIGLQDPDSPGGRMLELEALQISQQSSEIEELLDGVDPRDPAFAKARSALRVVEALAETPKASRALRAALAPLLPTTVAVPVPPQITAAAAVKKRPAPAVAAPPLTITAPPPLTRPLRVYAFDPSLGMRLETLATNEAIIEVPWEALDPGPVGEYLEVVDIDPPSECAYAPVDLDHPHILARRGLFPSDDNPQFHQQMVYGVAMRTIQHFERALGRRTFWAERTPSATSDRDFRFVRRLRIYPHALREANAYYSPERRALLFGYFNASHEDPGDNLPGGLVFTCLSHDIIAHETVHALLDGLHPRFKEQTNRDMGAFHEAFADIVALFQHFSMPEALRDGMTQARGELELAALLGGLASQFGQAIGRRGALRSYIAVWDEKRRQWVRRKPERDDYERATEVHDRGAVLVGAVFDAFLQIFKKKTEDLRRLATGGTGILPAGTLPNDLVERLCQEAAHIASRVLEVCIRALDYCPPFDVTFGEYLRALVTADRDLVPDDRNDYRVAFVSAFRARGIYPPEVTNLSVDGLSWRPPDCELRAIIDAVSEIGTDHWTLHSDRYSSYLATNEAAATLHRAMLQTDEASLRGLGLYRTEGERTVTIDGVKGQVSRLEVHSVRPCRRVSPDGEVLRQTIIEITQRWKPIGAESFYRGGCTLVCDGESREVRYVIRKRIGHPDRMAAQDAYLEERAFETPYGNYFALDHTQPEPFALLHRS